MKKFLCVLFACLFFACSNEKEAPNPNIQTKQDALRVFGVNPRLSVLLELLYPQGMIGLNYKPYPEDIEFMPENVANLPVLGMHSEINFEELILLKPDLVVFVKNTDKTFIEPYEKFGIKAVQISMEFKDIEDSIITLGEALGVQDRANKLLTFHKKQKAYLDELRTKVERKPRIYFAYGFEGLRTECAEEQGDLASLIGAENVIKCPPQMPSSNEGILVDFERIIAANPEVIFVREIGLYKELMNKPNEQWQRLEAIKNKKLFYAPSSPSNWLTRPPTAMRIIGYPWAFSKLHPDLLSEEEAKQIAKEFFAAFLRPINDEDYQRLEGK